MGAGNELVRVSVDAIERVTEVIRSGDDAHELAGWLQGRA